MLVLPQDPEAWSVDFDDVFWKWWTGDQPDPSTNQPAGWGFYSQPTGHAAVRSSLIVPDRPWINYLALHHSGALELELGEDGAADAIIPPGSDKRVRIFRLTTIVGRAWAAIALYSRVRERFGLSGSSEMSVALQNTKSAKLGEFGKGWGEPWGQFGYVTPAQPERNLLLRLELIEWPHNTDEERQLAMKIGGWIEDAWGNSSRRFLVQTGPMVGQFDTSAYRWR
jgi:hypothetical protein